MKEYEEERHGKGNIRTELKEIYIPGRENSGGILRQKINSYKKGNSLTKFYHQTASIKKYPGEQTEWRNNVFFG